MSKFLFIGNEQLKKEISKLAIDMNMTKVSVAEKLGKSRQNFDTLLNKKNLSFTDISKILDAMGCDLIIEFKPREESLGENPNDASNV